MLIRRDVTNPRAEIARQTGKEVLGFRWLDDEPEPTTTYPLVVEFTFCIDIGPPQAEPTSLYFQGHQCHHAAVFSQP